jgi:hypothetical protein
MSKVIVELTATHQKPLDLSRRGRVKNETFREDGIQNII